MLGFLERKIVNCIKTGYNFRDDIAKQIPEYSSKTIWYCLKTLRKKGIVAQEKRHKKGFSMIYYFLKQEVVCNGRI